jgi:hypothetical protein
MGDCQEEYYLLGYDAMWPGRNLPVFGGMYCLPSGSKNNYSACCLLGLLFCPRYGDSMFLRKVGQLLSDHVVSYSRRPYFLQNRYHWNLVLEVYTRGHFIAILCWRHNIDKT